jgi:hypothetical protein
MQRYENIGKSENQKIAYEGRYIISGVEYLVQFSDDRKFLSHIENPGDLLIEYIHGHLSFQNEFMRNMFGKKPFSNKQAKGPVTTEVIQCGKREIPISAIFKNGLFLPVKMEKDLPHFIESLGQDKKTYIRGIEMGIYDPKADGINVFQDT